MHTFNSHSSLTVIATAVALIVTGTQIAAADDLANTAYGTNALISNTANDNSAFGYGALQFNTLVSVTRPLDKARFIPT